MMKTLKAILFLTLLSCSGSRFGAIRYENFDHMEFVNGAIDRTGVKLNLSEEHSDGKGIMAIKDSATERSDSIFSIVSVSGLSPESLRIVNEVPTDEGMFVLTTEVHKGKQKTTFAINHWPNAISYRTTFSRLTLNAKPNHLEVTSGKIEYIGKRQTDQKEIILTNDFYFEED